MIQQNYIWLGHLWGISFCQESCTIWEVQNPVDKGINRLLTGAWYWPSTAGLVRFKICQVNSRFTQAIVPPFQGAPLALITTTPCEANASLVCVAYPKMCWSQPQGVAPCTRSLWRDFRYPQLCSSLPSVSTFFVTHVWVDQVGEFPPTPTIKPTSAIWMLDFVVSQLAHARNSIEQKQTVKPDH